MSLKTTLAFLLLLPFLQVISQINRLNTDSIRQTLQPGETKYVIETFVGDSVVSRQMMDTKGGSNNQEEKYIVRFSAEPLMGKRLKSTANAANLENEHTQFKKDFAELLSKSGVNQLKSSSGMVKREFRNLINGVAVSMPAAMAEQVKKLGYVTKVEKDEIVKINDDGSNEVILAPQVWNELGYTGKGVVIAIVDTGVDTSHICFSGDKFVKGYDFANNDDDPFDDHFHGTHCAGIAAANSDQIKGVAPDAKIMPVKVLNKDGYGNNSDIIAGIEFVVDPDHNPDTNDGAQVLSLSLGGQGYPDDASSVAIDNAVLHGAVCVVAAGNAGSSNYTIQSPGCARKALTVGSCNNSGVTSSFSSRGPVLITQAVKPEVSAPGEYIYSSVPGDKYENLSGTSMATPHVAGLAALLLQKNPTWEPENIKSAIIQSAQKVSGKVLEEGFGMVNAYKALQNELVIAPSVLDLGVINDSKGAVSLTQEIQMTNTTTAVKNISLSEGEKKDGFNISLSLSSLILNPGESKVVTVTCNIDPAALNVQDQIPMVYSELFVNDGAKTNRVPVVGLIGKSVNLVFENMPDKCLVFNSDWSSSFEIPLNTEQTFVIGKEKTDLLVSFDKYNRYVLKDDLYHAPDTIFLGVEDAKNEIHFKANGPDGSRLNLTDGTDELVRKKNGSKYNGFRLIRVFFQINQQTGLPDIKKYFSDISSEYVYENAFTAYPSYNKNLNQIIKIPVGINQGIKESKEIVINQNDYKKVHLQFDLDNYSDSLYYVFAYPGYSSLEWDPFNYRKQAIKAPYQNDFYFLPPPYDEYYLGRDIQILYWGKDFDFNYMNVHNYIPRFATGIITLNSKGKIITSPNSLYSKYLNFEMTDGNFGCNHNLKTLDNIQVNLGEMSMFKFPGAVLFGNYMQSYNDTVYLKIKHSDGNILRDTIYSHQWFPDYVDSYKAAVGSNDSICVSTTYPFDKSIRVQSLFEFKPRCQYSEMYRFPWQITLKGNSDQNKYMLPGSNSISFRGTGTMKMWIRQMKQKDWQEVPVKVEDESTETLNTYSAALPAGLNKGYYDLKIKQINDPNTPNELQTSSKWMPAFYVCNDTEADSLYLVNLYKSTGGEKWINQSGWLKEKLSDWYGITVENGRVVSVKLNSNNLCGSITDYLKNLTKLTSLDVSDNKLTYIADLSGIQSLLALNVQKNMLDFSSIVPNRFIAAFNFAPQDPLEISGKNKMLIGDTIRFDIAGYYPGNQYKWYYNDQLIYESDSSLYKQVAHSVDESGIYYAKVYHQDIPDFYIPTKRVTLNIQEKTFKALPDQSIETNNSGITSTNWVDVDNDGDEDLFIANRDYEKSGLYINQTKETGHISFEKSTFESLYSSPLSLCTSTWADYNNDGLEDLAAFSDHWWNGQGKVECHLFENLGNNQFEKKEIDISINKTTWEVLRGVGWTDFNHDNFLDLAIGYEEWIPNVSGLSRGKKLINNKGGFIATIDTYGRFTGKILFSDILKEKGTEMILSQGFFTIWQEGNWQRELISNPIAGTGIPSLGDFDNDGDLDIFSPVNNILFYNPNPQNCFLENTSGTLIERKDLSPTLPAIPSTSGSVCFDYDNDGDLDLAVSNFSATNELYKNLLMETGTMTFEPVDDMAFENEFGNWIGISTIDIDMDGYLDLSKVTPSGVYLSKNTNIGNSWLSVRCNGKVSNGSAIGAKVYAVATINGKKVTQYREILAASGETSVTSRRLHFGLGDASKIDSLIIKWPSGINNLFTDVDVNKFMEITESTDQIPVANAGSDQLVKTGESVTLDGLASYDHNGKNLSYKWTAPAKIILKKSNTATPSFTAPVSNSNKIYTFTLVVTNGINDSPVDEVSISVKGDRNLPVANAGSALIAREGEVVTLDGSASSDSDMDPLTYWWTAPLGILLNSNVAARPYFTAPQVKNDSVLSFSLKVNDGFYSSSLSTVKVTVLNVIPVGNATVNAPAFRVYPNPSEGMVYVETSAAGERMIKVSLCDLMGNELSGKEMIVHAKFKLDLSYLTSGVYFLKITDKDAEHISKIVIKK